MYPNKEQTEKLELAVDMARQTYNFMLQELQKQTQIDKAKIQAMLPDLKIVKPELKQVYAKVLQYECYKLFSNLRALSHLKKKGRKVGRLRFKGRGWFNTITFNQCGFKLAEKLSLSKIGEIKIIKHREVEGKIKQITIKKSLGKWYCIIVTDFIQKRVCGEKEIGIDLGINNYIMDSEGNFIEHPKILDKYSDGLKTAQQNLSRKKKESCNRRKAKFRVAKIHEKIERVRNDFLHKLSNQYVKDCKLIVVEDLAIKNMMESCYNAKNIADASWGRFVQFLCYKAENAGCKIEKINPKNTTKQCSNCGNIQKMPLWIRTYKCLSCGFEINRDLNSAINIKSKFIGSERANVEKSASIPLEQAGSMKQEAITSK